MNPETRRHEQFLDTCTGMSLVEANTIANMTVNSLYPPSNPIVLCRAAARLFQCCINGARQKAGWIIDWLCEMGERVDRLEAMRERSEKKKGKKKDE